MNILENVIEELKTIESMCYCMDVAFAELEVIPNEWEKRERELRMFLSVWEGIHEATELLERYKYLTEEGSVD